MALTYNKNNVNIFAVLFILEKESFNVKIIGNILWFLFTGFVSAVGYFSLGLLWCITIVGIPFGLQAFKFAKLVLFPFGKEVKPNFAKHPIANILWILLGGFTETLGFLCAGVLWCVTIVGIPFGLQCFKLAKLSLMPFGARIEN